MRLVCGSQGRAVGVDSAFALEHRRGRLHFRFEHAFRLVHGRL